MGCNDPWEPTPEEQKRILKQEKFQREVEKLHKELLAYNCAYFTAEELRRLIGMPSAPNQYAVPWYDDVDHKFLKRLKKEAPDRLRGCGD
jgi:hypothetical protein